MSLARKFHKTLSRVRKTSKYAAKENEIVKELLKAANSSLPPITKRAECLRILYGFYFASKKEKKFLQKLTSDFNKIRGSGEAWEEYAKRIKEYCKGYLNSRATGSAARWFTEDEKLTGILGTIPVNFNALKTELVYMKEMLNNLIELLKNMESMLNDAIGLIKKQKTDCGGLWGCIGACIEGMEEKSKYPNEAMVAAAVKSLFGRFYAEANEKKIHAEQNLASRHRIKRRKIYITKQPCFQEETIRVTSKTKNAIYGVCIDTNFITKKKIYPFETRIEENGKRTIETKKWYTGEDDPVIFTNEFKKKKYKKNITLIKERINNKWLPYEEIEEVKPGIIKRRRGCAVLLAHLKPKEVFFSHKTEPSIYSGCAEFLKKRRIHLTFVKEDDLNYICGLLGNTGCLDEAMSRFNEFIIRNRLTTVYIKAVKKADK